MSLAKLCLPRWCYALAYLHSASDQHRYKERLFRQLRTSTSHVRDIVNMLDNMGLITRKKKGRIAYIQLTKRGIQIAQKIWPIIYDLRELGSSSQESEELMFPTLFSKEEIKRGASSSKFSPNSR